ncbi:MAG TPA: PPK2 family polyphosphate kinase [Gammaproteobacteria bacterium]|jgi:PPK2 family polyphosphate:nucleotide phosphotransferase
MFEAPTHELLVPFDGSCRVADRPTLPAKKTLRAEDWEKRLEEAKREIGRLQHKLFADQRYALLLIFQALDAAGKDSTIRHVLTGVNPTGLHVVSFKRPSAVESAHDFLWRTTHHLPERGCIGVFNRSYYEEVLVVRVHPEFLSTQRLDVDASPEFWRRRYESIAAHEEHLARSGTVILKFWLNVSKEEQRERLLKRLDEPNKRWKFNPEDVKERDHWDEYQRAFEACLNATSRPWAPWYAVPADNKPFMRYQVAEIICNSLSQLKIDFPTLSEDHTKGLEAARRALRD